MYHAYILYSINLDKYYIGSTSDTLEQRLRRHNSNHSGFTGKSSDWEIVFIEAFPNLFQARDRENQIKKWKGRKMIEKLIAI